MAAYAGRLALGLAGRAGGERRDRIARGLWTAGCVLVWAHVICAFGFVHHWSHDEAYESTARQTGETIGLAWGGGIYFNYLFMLVWAGDAIWWRWAPASYHNRPAITSAVVHGYLAFIMFNATVVFEEGWLRYAALALTLILGIAGARVLAGRPSSARVADDR